MDTITPDLWSRVDEVFESAQAVCDRALIKALEASDVAGLPAIHVSALQGKLLYLLAKMQRARRILEVGTLGGYSTIWLARALEAGGKLVSLELDPGHAEVARQNLDTAELSDRVEVRVGPALDSLSAMTVENDGPFDFVFIDADKENNTGYFVEALRLSRPGTAIVIDNVVRGGEVADADSADSAVLGVRRMVERIRDTPSVSATTIQTVGCKGYDGFTLAVVG